MILYQYKLEVEIVVIN